jgi:hypothetical protein
MHNSVSTQNEVAKHKVRALMASLTVQRGPESWNYIYIMLGLSLGLEAAIIAMVSPLIFPYNFGVFILIATTTIYFFVRNERFQNWLLAFKRRYEKGRPR